MNVNFNPAQQRRDEAKYLGHSEKFPALQEHSVGELYPWSVVNVHNLGEHRGYAFPQNLVTGVVGPPCTYTGEIDGEQSETARIAAEQWISVNRDAEGWNVVLCHGTKLRAKNDGTNRISPSFRYAKDVPFADASSLPSIYAKVQEWIRTHAGACISQLAQQF